MPTHRARVVILGAGITGLTVAWELSKRFPGEVIVLEKATVVGGLAGTFSKDKLTFDHGSHRLHEGYEPAVGALIKDICGEDLLRRERRGCLYLNDRPIPYPPSALDIATAFGARDLLRFSLDLFYSRLRGWAREESADFETFTIGKVGRSLYESFYKPYAVKLYGMSPKQLSRDPAVHRVRKFSWHQISRDLRRTRSDQPSYYYYPRHGIGQLSETLRQRLTQSGEKLFCASTVHNVRVEQDNRIHRVSFALENDEHTVETELVVSTIPLDALYHSIQTDKVERHAFDLRWRGLRLLYLTISEQLVGNSETYYFPEAGVPFGRVSELHRYSPSLNPDKNRSALTIEIPCSPDDRMWSMPDEELAVQCIRDLRRLGVLRSTGNHHQEAFSVRLKGVYPIYELGWRERFERVYAFLDRTENLYMIGRSALFLHCNIDHCMFMAIRLAEHLESTGAHKEAWRPIQQGFLNYRVRE
jgi:protoporphyrinogen oxidase